MSAADLLSQLRELGVRLRVEQGELKISAPKGVLTAELRERLKAAKNELTELLQIAGASAAINKAKIIPGDRSSPIPLSYAQQRMWFLEEFEGGSSVYNIPWAMRLKGPLDSVALQASIDALVKRHESLRTIFVKTDAGPEQQVLEHMPLLIAASEMHGASGTQLRKQLEDWSRERFDLTTGPLLTIRLIEFDANDHVLMMVMHHIISDAWSLDVLQNELFALYFAAKEGGSAQLAELPLQFADYAVWQRSDVQQVLLDEQLAYWKEKLRGAPPLLELPTDHARPAEQSYAGARVRRLLPADVRDGLKALAKDTNGTLFMVLLAAFNVLLSRYSGQDDIVVGTPIAGRQQTELEGLIGLFLNTLVFRTELSGDPSFASLLEQVQATALDAYAHQDLPFDKIVDVLQPSRDMSYSPVFQVQFMLQNAPASAEPVHGLVIEGVEFEYGTAKFDLTLATGETPDGLMAEIEYCTDLFDARTIERMLGHFENLLRGILANPSARVAELPLAGAEDAQLLAEWNATAADYPLQETLVSLLEAQVAATPTAVALSYEDAQLTYAELNAQANRVAHRLISDGVQPEHMVGVYMERSIEMVVALLGIVKAGAAYVPLDPDYPEQRLGHMLEDAEMGLVLTQQHLQANVPAAAAAVLAIDATDLLATQPAGNPELRAAPNNVAYVIFTSGSTGRPKGVMNEHHGIVNRLLWMQSEYELNASDRILQKTPFSFDVSVWEFFWPLIAGAQLVMARPGGHKDSDYLAGLIQSAGITTLHFVPSMLQVFLQAPAVADCGSLTRVICSGEALSHDLQARFYKSLATPTLHNLYGPTEAAIDVSYWPCERDSADFSVPIGRPVANTQLHVVEPGGALAPVGVAGELWIAGEQVARGYVNRPDLTSERFIANPFAASADAAGRVYKTGDLVRWRNDGVLEFLGRIDHQVKLRGFRIELGEIEACLDAQPAVEQSLVLLREDIPGNKRLVAYVASSSGAVPDVPDLRSALKASLPEYMVPAAFVVLREFPLLPNGKVDRKSLPEPEGRRDVADEFVPAVSEPEKILTAIWSDLLRVERIGVNDNFFELGGDSILSIQIIARAAKAGLKITPKQVFKHQTVAELAAVAGTGVTIDAEQGEVTGNVPFTPVQCWFLEQGAISREHFNQSVMLEVSADLGFAGTEAIVKALHRHHDALRLQLVADGEDWQQLLAAVTAVPELMHVDLTDLAAGECEAAIQDECNRAQASLDLSSGNLLAARYFERGPAQPALLLLVIHHFAIDGVGWRVLFEDLETAGQQLLAGKAIALPAKTSSFKAWAEHLQVYAAQPELEAELHYWRSATAAVSDLPVDCAGGANTVASARHAQFELSADATASLLRDVPAAYRTRINDVLLTALARAVKRWSGQSEVLIDLEGHGREELFDDLDVSRTLGWFTSIYPLRLSLSAAGEPGADLQAIKECIRAVPGNGIGYGLLRYLANHKELDEAVPAQILFNYLGQFDQALDESGLFAIAPVASGFDQAAGRMRSHVLDINGSILNGCLRISLGYSTALHESTTIEQLAHCYLEELQALIAHCVAPESYGRTPADYPLCELQQADVDRLVGTNRAVSHLYPVTAMQHGMLFHSLYDEQRDSYLSQVIWGLQGRMDSDAFAKAWQLITDRHSALRTGFDRDASGRPVQVVYAQTQVGLVVEDLSALQASDREQKLLDFLAADRQQGFDLSQPPLMRLNLFVFGTDEYRFVWTYHHIVIDGWSIPVVIGELMDAYQSFALGAVPELAEPRPFGDYVEWLCAQDYGKAETFWRETLQDVTAPTELPAAIQSYNPALGQGEYRSAGYAITAEQTADLRAFARDHRLTLNTLVQGVWAILLSRYTTEEQVIYGATTSARPAELKNIESMVGLLINALPVASRIPADMPVIDWLAGLQEQQLTARQFEFASLVEVQSWSLVPHSSPLFNTLLVFENYPDVESLWTRSNDALAITDMRPIEWTNYPLTVAVSVAEQLHVRLDYDQQYYSSEIVDQLAGHFMALLAALVAQPELPATALPMLAQAERHKLLVDWNNTAFDYPHDATMHSLFEAQVAQQPDSVALWCKGEELTYAELNQRANKLARHLQALDAAPGMLVGISIERGPHMIVGQLAVLKAGAAYVPLDPNYPPERVAFMLEDSQASVLLTQESLVSSLPDHSATVICLDSFDWMPDDAALVNPQSSVTPADLGYVIYTSGSTGKPKGVAIEHRNAVALIEWARDVFAPEEFAGVLASTSVCFDLSVFEIFVTLGIGGRIVLVDNALALRGLPAEAGVTLVNTVPSAIAELVRIDGIPASVKTVNLAGEPLTAALADAIYAVGTITAVNDLYGPSEDTTYSTWTRRVPGAAATIGRPLHNTQVYLLDARGEPVPAGVPGEMYLGGAGVSRGYLNRPELTAEKYVPDPFSDVPQARLYRTGDRARYRLDGNIEFQGRIDDQIKLRGFRIELGEIEARLLDEAAVDKAVVIVREDTPDDQRLVAYVTAADAGGLDAAALRNVLGVHLPQYMVPSAFVVLDEIPLTPNGKLDRKALPAPEWSGQTDYQAASTPTEQQLVDIWQTVLGAETVGVNDNFFDLGGHSLLAMQLVSRVRDVFAVELPLVKLFEQPTVAALAALLDAAVMADAQPLVPVDRARPLPLSFSQLRMWFLDVMEPGSATYNVPWVVEAHGELDIAALQYALDQLVERHESMRTTFAAADAAGLAEPVQIIAPAVSVPLVQIDLQSATDAEMQTALHDFETAPFDLQQGPLFRFVVLKCAPQRHILMLCMHHIICDDWSLGLLYRELTQLYTAKVRDEQPELAPLPLQYADYAVWQRDWLSGAELERQFSYWKTTLSDAPPLLDMPLDKPRPPVETHRGAAAHRMLEPVLTKALEAEARKQGCTTFVLLLAALNVLLHRYSGETDIVVGTPITGRQRSELEGVVGFFLNTLAIRTDLSGNPGFAELVARVKDRTLQAFAHQDLPFEKLVEELQPARNMSHAPVFQVLFVFNRKTESSADFGELQLQSTQFAATTAKFDLEFTVAEVDTGLAAHLRYYTDLYEPATIERMLDHFSLLLGSLVADSEQTIGTLPMLTEHERRQQLVDWNSTRLDYDRAATLHSLVEGQAAQQPAAVALWCDGEELTYAELNRRANKLAAHLASLGAAPETLVGICVARRLEMIVGMLAILKAGAAYVPIDPDYPPDRVAFMLADSEAPLLLTQSALVDILPDSAAQQVVLDEFDWATQAAHDANPLAAAGPANLAYTIYTSGSTGKPKGVEIEHRNAVALVEWAGSVFTPAQFDGVLASTSICFDLSVFEIFVTLGQGGRIVLVDNALALPDLPATANVRLINTVPSAIAELVRMDALPPSLATVNLAGEPLKTELVNAIYATPTVQQVNDLYGPSEDTTYSTWTTRLANAAPTIGRPIANTQAYLLDALMQPVPLGASGELYLGGAGVTRGYRGRPELTAEKYVDDPFSDVEGSRLYRTGDRARYRPDGNLEFLGRIDDQIKLRGFRIELGEIEARLLAEAAVDKAVVIVREDSPGDQRLVGYVTAAAEGLDEAALRAALGVHLPQYMVPSAFVLLDEIPLTPNGKVDRKALPAPEWGGEAEYAAPATPTEQQLVDIWQAVLGAETIGVHDNFFDLGGHSLLAMQLISRVRDSFAVELPLVKLFEQPTVAALAASIDADSNTSGMAPGLMVADRSQPLRLSFAQQRLWFLDVMEPGSATYNVPWVAETHGELDIAALQYALDQLVARHESLRTTFAEGPAGAANSAAEPVQIIAPAYSVAISQMDLQSAGEADIERALNRCETEPFDLAQGPLFRFVVLKCAPRHHILMLCMHHIICDDWSLGLLYRELTQLYSARLRGEQAGLAALPLQYADYAAWQRDWLSGAELERQFNYWKTTLRDAPPLLDMPLDKPRPPVETHQGASAGLLLDSTLSDALEAEARSQGCTTFVLLLAALNVLLNRYTDATDIVVGTPMSGRQRSELEGVVGFFLNTLAIRTDLAGNPGFDALLARVKDRTLQAFAHQDLPFEKLVEELQPVRNMSHAPVFQVLFVFNRQASDAVDMGDLALQSTAFAPTTAKFDLEFTVAEQNEGLGAYIRYNTALYEAATIERMLEHFRMLLEGIVANVRQPIRSIPLLAAAERQAVLTDFNATSVEYTWCSVVDAVRAQAESTPSAIAIEAGPLRLSYADLELRAVRLANSLLAQGVGPGALVAIAAERGPDLPVAVLAVLKTGAAYVPVDPDYPADRISYMLADSQAQALVTQSHLRDRLAAKDMTIIELDTFDWEAGSDIDPRVSPKADDPLYAIYTSGSTGKPKGVLLNHGGLANLLQWQSSQGRLSMPARTLQFASFSFDVSFQEVFSTWQQGGTLVMIDEVLRRDLPALARFIASEKIARLFLPYAAFQPLAECLLQAEDVTDLAVRDVVVAGEQLQVTPPIRELFSRVRSARLHNHYGPSETHVVTAYTLDEDPMAWRALPPIGLPVANTQAYILDENLEPLPVGVPGELYIGGVQVGIGYRHRPELTAEKFVPDPYNPTPGSRMYRTGDRVRRDISGNILYLGRADDQVKWRGFRIEPGEIESLLTDIPGVKLAAVLLREDNPGDKRLIAYATIEPDAAVDADTLRAHCKEYLPDYMVPSGFMLLEVMPVTPSGKINRRALPVPDLTPRGEGELPGTLVEQHIARIWQALLKVDSVRLDDDFFDLGGHSLLTIQLARQIQTATGRQLSIADVFENPTVRELSVLLEDADWDMAQVELPQQGALAAIRRFVARLLRIT